MDLKSMFNKKKIQSEDSMNQKENGAEFQDDNLPMEEEGETVHDITVDDEPENTSAPGSETDKLAEMNDKYLRLHADFENFRRRTNLEKADLLQFGNKDLILKILPVYDDFERALELMQKAEDKNAIVEGVQLIFNKFTNVLQQAGLKEIEVKGQPFDPELHDAITKIAVSPDMSGKIVDQVQKGYMLKDKIIRHSKVVVGE